MSPIDPAGSDVAIYLAGERESFPAEERTYIILGHPRGGTTMVAGQLQIAGIFMGEQIDSATNEDLLFRQGNTAAIRKAISRRNREHSSWGWKDPGSFSYLEDVFGEIRAPHFLTVFRDPMAVALRIHKENGRSAFDLLDEWAEFNRRLLSFLRNAACPTLLVSYEKALRHPDALATALEHFLGGGWSATTRKQVSGYVNASGGYHAVWPFLRQQPRPFSHEMSHPDVSSGNPPFSDRLTWNELHFERPERMALHGRRWLLTGDDPWCFVADEDVIGLNGDRWVRFEIELPPGRLIRPRLYLDIGDGLGEGHAIHLPPMGAGSWWFRVEFPPTLAVVRFDPDDGTGEIGALIVSVASVGS